MPRWCPFLWLFSLATALPAVGLAQSGPPPAPPGWTTYGPGFARPGDCPPAQLTSGPANTVFEQLPDDTGWLYDDTPAEIFLRETFRHAYVRIEYLNWDITDPGNNQLSGDTNYPTFLYPPDLVRNPINPTQFIPASIYSVGNDPRAAAAQNQQGLPSFDGGGQRFVLPPVYHITNPAFVVDATAQPPMYIGTMPTTEPVLINENNGIRGTFGFAFPWGAVEASVFGLQPSTSNFAPKAALFLDFADIDDDNGDLILGDGDTTEFLPTFNAIVQAISIDGQIPSVPIAVTLNERQTPANPQLPVPTTPGAPLNEPLTRGDNLRIVYDPVLDPITGAIVANPTAGLFNPLTGNRLVPVYQASLNTQVWGTDANYIAPVWDEGSPLHFQPMFGFRYFNFEEDLRQSGLYTFTTVSPAGAVTRQVVTRRIDSTVVNNVYGPQIGLRSEYNHKWFSVGAQPKFMLGMNSYKTAIQTVNILGPDDRDQDLQDNETRLGAFADLQVYSRVNLTSHFSIFAAYNFLWTGQITRPADNIIYNARTLGTVVPPDVAVSERDLESDFHLKPQFSSAILQGVSVGGELRF